MPAKTCRNQPPSSPPRTRRKGLPRRWRDCCSSRTYREQTVASEMRSIRWPLEEIEPAKCLQQKEWRRTQSRANSSPGNPCKKGKIQGINCFGASVSQLRRCNKPYLQEMFKPELKTIRDLTGSVFPEPAATETWTESEFCLYLRSCDPV